MVERTAGALTDEVLLELLRSQDAAKVGIDAPLGWPLAFIDAITAYRDGDGWLPLEANEIRFRATESLIGEEMGQNPLSVALSDLAWPAMRCARLLSQLDGPLDRTGAGVIAEVYPMAALRRWDIVKPDTPAKEWSYKGDGDGRSARRREYMDRLLGQLAGQVDLPEAYVEACAADDDDFDAFVCSLVARATVIGATDPIPRGMHWAAMREGWIKLPTRDSLTRLSQDAGRL